MKSNSPFKMVWPWVGAGVAAFIVLKDLDFLMNPGGPEAPLMSWFQANYPSLGHFGHIPLLLTVGFLLGWIIEKIIKK